MPPINRNGIEIIPIMLQNQACVSAELTASLQFGQPYAGGAVTNTAMAPRANRRSLRTEFLTFGF